MTRREFFVAVFTLIAGSVSRPAQPKGFVDPIASAVHRALPYLKFEPGAVDAFVAAYRTAHPRLRLARTPDRPKLVKSVLMSMDFFQNGADESRPLRFVALFGPYVTPCYSPFRDVS